MRDFVNYILQWPVEIWASIIALIGAAIGYAFREFRNRAKPFFQIISIGAGLMKKTDLVEIGRENVDRTASSFFIGPLSLEIDLDDLTDIYRRINHFLEGWPEIENAVEKIISATSDSELSSALATIVSSQLGDECLVRMLAHDRLQIPLTSKQETVIPVHDDLSKGTVWMMFPRKGASFGQQFQNPAIRAKCAPFIEAVKTLDSTILKDCFTNFREQARAEMQMASLCRDEVKRKLDEKSRWYFRCYLANLSSAPLVVQKNSTIVIEDKTKVKYNLKCSLIKITARKEGGHAMADSECPIVIRGSDDSEFGFVTDFTQDKMAYGNAIRECFERGQATCRLHSKVKKVGLFSVQTCSTDHAKFVDSK